MDAEECDATMARMRREKKSHSSLMSTSFESDPADRFYLPDEIMVQFEPHISAKVLVSKSNISIAMKNFYVPADPLFSYQWYLYHEGGLFFPTDSHIDVMRAWGITQSERGVIVAVAGCSLATGRQMLFILS